MRRADQRDVASDLIALELPRRLPRALMAYRSDVDVRGGAATVMEETAAALRELGVHVDITYDMYPRTDGYDVVQPVNIWSPDTALEQLRNLRAQHVPLAWQPFYLHWCELAWASVVVHSLTGRGPDEARAAMDAMAGEELVVHGLSRHLPNEIVPGLHAALAEMAALVDHVCACSVHEMQMLARTAGLAATPFTLTRHGVRAGAFAGADPAPFRELVGPEPFVLCVGSIDVRKNQAMLAHALADHDLRLVLVGPCFEPHLLEIVRAVGGSRMLWFDRLPRELVASAVNAAAVHALPSYAEGSALASMEAAAAGCPVVVSNRSSEFEYYGDRAFYCDPVDPASIRRAVELAARERAEHPQRVRELAAHVAGFTWATTARDTLTAWARAIDAGRARARAACPLAEVRRTLVLARAEEVCADPALLAAYARTVTDRHDATLVIAVPEAGQGELVERLGAAADAVAAQGTTSPDLLALTIPPGGERLLARAADALLSRRPGDGAAAHLTLVPVGEPAAELGLVA